MTLPTSVDFGEPERLMRTAVEMEESEFAKARAPYNYDDLVERFEQSLRGECRLSALERRKLAWALPDGIPPLYTRPSLVQALDVLGGADVSTGSRQEGEIHASVLRGVLASYFVLDPGRAPEQVGAVRDWLFSQLSAYCGANSTILHWRQNLEVFKEQGAKTIGKQLCSQKGDLTTLFTTLHLPPKSHVARNVLEGVAEAASGDPVRADELMALLDSGDAHHLRTGHGGPALFEPEAVRRCLHQLLSAADVNNPGQLGPHFADFALKHLGDPRLDPRRRWVAMSAESRDLMSTWIAREDLGRFFDEIRSDSRRKRFWQRFLAEGRITFSRVILGEHDTRSGSPQLREQIKLGRYARLHGGPDTSALMLGIDRHCLVIDFGVEGNATYLYPEGTFAPQFLQRRYYDITDLRLPDHVRFIHQDGPTPWEKKLLTRLADLFSVKAPA